MGSAPGLLCNALILHSQTVVTEKPSLRKALTFRASRRLLASIFSSQNCRLRLGTVAALQPPCPCQKHPWTKIAHLPVRLTISGVPGRSRLLQRKRMPARQSHRRSANSGAVPTWRTKRIRSDVSGSTFNRTGLRADLRGGSGGFRDGDIRLNVDRHARFGLDSVQVPFDGRDETGYEPQSAGFHSGEESGSGAE